MSCIRTNHVKGMNESCHMYKRVVPHVFTRNWCTRIHMRETFLFHFYISSLRDIEFQEVLLIARIITLVYTCVTWHVLMWEFIYRVHVVRAIRKTSCSICISSLHETENHVTRTYKRVMPHVYTRNCCTRMCLTSGSIFIKKSETRHSHMNESCHMECLFVISERLLVLFIYRVYVKLRFSDFRADLLLALICAVTHWYVHCSTL